MKRLLWLGNGDANVCEDYLLAGLAAIGCPVEIQVWKGTFDEKRDPARHGGHGYTVRLSGEIPRMRVERPEAIVVSRAWPDQERVERTLAQHPGVPVVFFDGEDSYHGPDWLRERVCRVFVAQCAEALAASDPFVRPLPPCARVDLIPEPLEDKPFAVVWGGKLCMGHGGRAPLLGPAIAACVIDDVVSYAPWNDWMWRLLKARFLISIGAAGNPDHSAGANVSYFEAGAGGATLLAYPPGIVLGEPMPGAVTFRTGAELLDLCRAVQAGDLKPVLSPMELRRFVEEHHSHTARAKQFIKALEEIA